MIEQLKKELRLDEGFVYEIYKCPAGELTFGIGHMIKPHDPEYGKPVGTPVMPMRVEEVFEQDVNNAVKDCHSVFPQYFEFPVEAQKILANMMFQLGMKRFCGFKKMIAAVDDRDWRLAAEEMRDSLWNKQTHARSERLVSRMMHI